jgi:hypothetical protein
MIFRNLLAINAVIAVPMGFACMLAPARLLAAYGVSLPPMGLVVYQFWGVTLVGLGLLSWFARSTEPLGVQKAMAVSLLIFHGLSCAVAVRGQFAGANNLGWSTVGLFLMLALTFAYLWIARLRRG